MVGIIVPDKCLFKYRSLSQRHEGGVASDSGVCRTGDAGNTWSLVTALPRSGWYDIECSDAQTGYLSGDDGVIARTTYKGLNWSVTNTPLQRKLVSMSFPRSLVGYATATGYNWQFLKTTDGGAGWTLDTIQPLSNVGSLESVYFTSETRGYIGGWYIAIFVGTQDGGDSWQDLAATSPLDLYSIDFRDSLHGFACGLRSTICRTLDGGESWIVEELPGITVRLLAIRFLDAQTGFVVGEGGLIFKNTSGSTTSLPELQDTSIRLFPNPVESGQLLHWSLDEAGELVRAELPDQKGRRLLRFEPGQIHGTFRMPELAPGIYHPEYQTRSGMFRRERIMVR